MSNLLEQTTITTPQGATPSPGATGAATEKTFTQKDIDAILGRVRDEAREVAKAGLLKDLGVPDTDALKAALKQLGEMQDAQKTDAQKQADALAKAQADAAKAKAERDEILSKATMRLMQAAVIAEATTQNFADPSDAWAFVEREKIATEGDSFKGIKEVVAEVAKAKPHLLKQADALRIGTPRPGMARINNKQAQPIKVAL